MSDQTNDLSHMLANSDLNAAQEHHSNLPDEAMLHFTRAFAAKAGIAPHPGKYSGPAIKPPDDWETPHHQEAQPCSVAFDAHEGYFGDYDTLAQAKKSIDRFWKEVGE
jgi:hypothetical protein